MPIFELTPEYLATLSPQELIELEKKLKTPISILPTLACTYTKPLIAVLAYYTLTPESPIPTGIPIQNANVRFDLGAVITERPKIETKTNIYGLAEGCSTRLQYVEAWIQKSGVNFGSGVGVWHRIGSVSGIARKYPTHIFYAPVKIKIPEPKIPEIICKIWDTIASISVPVMLQAPFPITIGGAKWVCREDPTKSEFINDVNGKIVIGTHSFDFLITNGSWGGSLKDFIDIPTLISELGG